MSEKQLAALVLTIETLPHDASKRAILDIIADIKTLPVHSAVFTLERLALTLLERTQHVRH